MGGHGGIHGSLGGIEIVTRHEVFLEELLDPLQFTLFVQYIHLRLFKIGSDVGDAGLGVIESRLRGRYVRLRLFHLRAQDRRVQLCQELPFLDLGIEVGV